jgi:hypothetical protein
MRRWKEHVFWNSIFFTEWYSSWKQGNSGNFDRGQPSSTSAEARGARQAQPAIQLDFQVEPVTNKSPEGSTVRLGPLLMALDLEEQLVSRCLQILLFMLTLVGYCLVVSDPDFNHHIPSSNIIYTCDLDRPAIGWYWWDGVKQWSRAKWPMKDAAVDKFEPEWSVWPDTSTVPEAILTCQGLVFSSVTFP